VIGDRPFDLDSLKITLVGTPCWRTSGPKQVVDAGHHLPLVCELLMSAIVLSWVTSSFGTRLPLVLANRGVLGQHGVIDGHDDGVVIVLGQARLPHSHRPGACGGGK
jgi:hypothetical protein